VRVIKKIPKANKEFNFINPSLASSWAPYKIFNIGNSQPTQLMDFINEIEKNLGIKAKKEFCEMQPGDVSSTSAETYSLEKWIGFKPNTSISKGISEFIDWYKKFYN